MNLGSIRTRIFNPKSLNPCFRGLSHEFEEWKAAGVRVSEGLNPCFRGLSHE